MDLLQVTRGHNRRYYLDGKRVSEGRVRDLKRTGRQDSFSTEITGALVRHRSVLHAA